MRKPEQRVWDAMRSHAPPTVWLERVENLLGDGMPDVHVAVPQQISWVELKHSKRPARKTTRLLGDDGLRVSQISWHLKAASLQLPCFTLIRDDTLQLYLIEARHADNINDMTCDELRLVSVADSWHSIFAVLSGRRPA